MTVGTELRPNEVAIDRELAEIASRIRFLLDVTPVNLIEARTRFLADGTVPDFEYTPLGYDPAGIETQLGEIAIDGVSDATLAGIFTSKRRELELQSRMLRCRGSSEFRELSMQLYGAVSPGLLGEAEALLARVPPPRAEGGDRLDATAFAHLAEAELDLYRAAHPGLTARVEVRDDSSGIMVANGNLLIAPTALVPSHRVQPLLQHEIGTHIVTHVNGRCQPLRLLGAGLAGYDETQEGLAVLAEHLAGGLTPRRLRQLAARVVAVAQMCDGASFPSVHRSLVDSGVAVREAFTITMRVFRSGGLTKDAVYLPRAARRPRLRRHRRRFGRAVARQDGTQRCPPRRRAARPWHPRLPGAAAALPGRPGSQGTAGRDHGADGPGRLDRRSSVRIGFVVNDVDTERPQYTTTRLAMAASRRGHEVWLMGVGDFSHRGDGSIGAKAREAPGRRSASLESYLRAVQRPKREIGRLSIDELDVLMMRNDPAEDATDRPWAVASGAPVRPAQRPPRCAGGERSDQAWPTRSTRRTSSTSRR